MIREPADVKYWEGHSQKIATTSGEEKLKYDRVKRAEMVPMVRSVVAGDGGRIVKMKHVKVW